MTPFPVLLNEDDDALLMLDDALLNEDDAEQLEGALRSPIVFLKKSK